MSEQIILIDKERMNMALKSKQHNVPNNLNREDLRQYIINKGVIFDIVDNLFMYNKSPMEHFGIDPNKINKLEKKIPSMVIKKSRK